MTGVQKTELEILKEFISVCDKLDLRYYLVCGSALGAVKYKGFIPWDDDIDVALLRDDYTVFCRKAPEMLPEGLFLQTYQTDREFPCVYAKLRNSSTTFIENSVSNLNINHGVYIDVFPLDGYPRIESGQQELERKKRALKLKLTCAFKSNPNQSIKAKVYLSLLRLLGYHRRTQATAEKLEKLLSSFNTESSELWCNHGNWQKQLEYAPKEQYGNGTAAEFEGISVRIPENYDAYLTQKYGDWRADLPDEQKQSHHDVAVCDLEKPYTEYFR